ncbi:ODR4-like domain containing protein [Trichuris trichiura]|uniref:ODR4-like domain containing protein n=1 Tax=Trichuris trichiura TaxID=36087 RepID=A0A077Z2C8_TRITR|nr:ODR4-like domain containing protein [Trichuris trichiura]
MNSSNVRLENYNNGQEGAEEVPNVGVSGQELPDEECLYSRARQLLRMLPGGIEISGLVLVGSESEVSALECTATRFLKRLRKLRDRHVMLENEASLLTRHLFIWTISNSWENCNIRLMKFSGTKAYIEMGSTFAVGDIFWCSVQSTVAANILDSCDGSVFGVDFQKRFVDLIIPYAGKLFDSYLLINGHLCNGHEPTCVSEVLNKEDFLAPLKAKFLLNSSDQRIITEVERNSSVCARMQLTGFLAIRAFIPSVCTTEEVITALRKDILRTLYIRGELHHEERLVTGAEIESNSYRNLPRRVFVSLGRPGEGFDVCEYIMHDEDLSFLENEVNDFFRTSMSASSVELDAEPLMSLQTKKFPLSPVSAGGFSLFQKVFGRNADFMLQSAVRIYEQLTANTLRILALALIPFVVFWFFELIRTL